MMTLVEWKVNLTEKEFETLENAFYNEEIDWVETIISLGGRVEWSQEISWWFED